MRKHIIVWGLCSLMWLGWAAESRALFTPGVVLGGNALLNREAGAQPGAYGGLLQLEVGYLWEWPRKHVALGVMLPLETDFGTRFGIGGRLMLELAGSFRFFTGAMADIGPPYSFFFLRNGISIGWRNTGKRPKGEHTVVEGGVYIYVALDYRVPNPNQAIPQYLRLVWGLRLEFGKQFGKDS